MLITSGRFVRVGHLPRPHPKLSTDMPPPQVTDAPEPCTLHIKTRASIPFAFFKVPNRLRLFLDDRSSLQATCLPKQRISHQAHPSVSKDRLLLRSRDRKHTPSRPNQPSRHRAGGHVSYDAVRTDCPICCSRLQPLKLPPFEASHTHEHLPDFLYVVDLSVSEAPEMYVCEWPSLPQDMDGRLDLDAYFVRGGMMPRIAHLRLDGVFVLRRALIQRAYERHPAQETRRGQGRAPTLHRSRHPAARTVVI